MTKPLMPAGVRRVEHVAHRLVRGAALLEDHDLLRTEISALTEEARLALDAKLELAQTLANELRSFTKSELSSQIAAKSMQARGQNHLLWAYVDDLAKAVGGVDVLDSVAQAVFIRDFSESFFRRARLAGDVDPQLRALAITVLSELYQASARLANRLFGLDYELGGWSPT